MAAVTIHSDFGVTFRSPKRRGSLRCLPPLEVRPSSVAPDPAESRGAPPPPQYFGEFTEWTGYAILTWSPAGLLFAIWTFANLGPRAKSLTEKYEKEFGEEYKKLNKKHIIPFIW